MQRNRIGGFFELELPDQKGGMLAFWNVPDDPNYSFALARSAFAALVQELEPQQVWIPAYLCRSVSDQVMPERLRFYPVGETLTPAVEFLADALQPGDMVVGMNYFGRAPSSEFRVFAAGHTDVVFVEDCAQTIDTGVPAWGDYRIFSPRKLLGVPDGGFVVPTGGRPLAEIRSVPHPDLDGVQPALLRFEDEAGERWMEWHDRHESWRLALAMSDRRMSRLARTILGLVDPDEVSRTRRENFAVLAALLPDVSYLAANSAGEEFVPFGFPVRFPPGTRDAVRAALWAAGIYAFRHFAHLPSPEADFPLEHSLSAQLMTLPCDQRYGPDDMEFIASTVRQAAERLV